jgi:drug/metabolite transporter (DMT)-like permease
MAPRTDASSEPNRASVLGRLALGMATFGSATPISKIVTGAMPVFVASALRVALGALVLAPFVLTQQDRAARLEWRDWALVAVIAVFGMFGFSTLMLYGMKEISGVAGAIVMSTSPAVTAAGSMLFLKDRPTWRKLVAVALAVSGVVILHLGTSSSDDDGTRPILGMALVFGAVVCEAIYTLVGKKAAERVAPTRVACLAASMALPLFIPFAVWQWSDFKPSQVSTGTWVALAWYGAGILGLGTWLWYSGVRAAQGAVAAAFMGVMPCSALVLSYALLGEPFRWIHLAGFVVVLGGVALISQEHHRMEKHKASERGAPPGAR